MIGYGDMTRTYAEVFKFFHEKYPEFPPTSQGTIEKRVTLVKYFAHKSEFFRWRR